ncbi:hypothetical protein I552_5440 [Mycobacterium xenopi 3993]|nr:hypothetical protein I552_5440 [Mycobacterium xenopi 3993]
MRASAIAAGNVQPSTGRPTSARHPAPRRPPPDGRDVRSPVIDFAKRFGAQGLLVFDYTGVPSPAALSDPGTADGYDSHRLAVE